ncbi:MAG: Outer membrane protein assembly factor BamA [Elusimicrobia bacterium]|nr:Outer membrane protein assembly factor BamA [Elusimicrobiota bacterium]
MTISRITIRGTDIFDFETQTYLRKFPYTTINFLHIQTKEHVIKNELLFKVGDKVDPFLLSETERNLRALSFIRAARVAQFPQRDGTVALVVYVNDSWTTEPQFNLGGQNSIESTEIGFKEKNLFGLGKNVSFFYEEGENFIQREYNYTDPRFLGSRWQLKGGLINRTEAKQRDISMERPFYSIDTKWSGRMSHDYAESVIDEFENNKQVSRFAQTKETTELTAAAKIGGGRDVISRTGLRWRKTQINYERIDQTSLNRSIPEDAQLQTIFVDLNLQQNEFFEATHLEKMTRVEDFNKGPILRLSPGVSPRELNGTKHQTESEATFESRIFLKNRHMFHQSYLYSGRNTFEKSENQRYGIKWKYYYLPNHKHTLVVHSRADWGHKLDPDSQIELGGENGLRAFEADSIVGNKGWVFNIEDRMFFVDEVFSLFSLGGVVFYDMGYVWAKENPVALSQLRSDMGAGLRIGLTRSSNEVIIRFDLSYRHQVDNPGDSHWVVTFGTGQAF